MKVIEIATGQEYEATALPCTGYMVRRPFEDCDKFYRLDNFWKTFYPAPITELKKEENKNGSRPSKKNIKKKGKKGL